MRKFASPMDAVMWVAELERPCSRRTPSDECDLGRPCVRHRNVAAVGMALWRRQVRRARAGAEAGSVVRVVLGALALAALIAYLGVGLAFAATPAVPVVSTSGAQSPATSGAAGGDLTIDSTLDAHTETSSTDDHHSESADDHHVEDNHSVTDDHHSEVSSGDSIVTSTAVGNPLHRAETAPNAVAGSMGGVGPCGEHTGMSAQTGIVGGGLATIPEACRAFRVDEYERVGTSRARRWAVELSYWLGYPSRLALAVVSGGALN